MSLFQDRGLPAGIRSDNGLPAAIRSDNGLPFANPNGLYNLSKLSVWWLDWASRSSASGRDARSRTAATRGCTAP